MVLVGTGRGCAVTALAALLGIPPEAAPAWVSLTVALDRLAEQGRRPVCASRPGGERDREGGVGEPPEASLGLRDRRGALLTQSQNDFPGGEEK